MIHVFSHRDCWMMWRPKACSTGYLKTKIRLCATLNEIKRIVPMWSNYHLFHGQWTVSFCDIDVAVFFKMKWG